MATEAGQVTVVLVGLDGLTVSGLRRELAGDEWLSVVHLSDDAPPHALTGERHAVVVVDATAGALRRATHALAPGGQVVAMLVLFAEPPGSDAYLVAPARRDVSVPELAQLVRDLAADASAPRAIVPVGRDHTRSQP